MSNTVSVASLVKYIKSKVDMDPKLQDLTIKGEISNFTAHRSGHYYFTLKDDKARISCVMFASKVRNVRIKLEDGLSVLVKGTISVYEATGQCQIYCDSIELDGLGQIYLKIEELKKKLTLEGIFEESHKKSIPLYPMQIGVVSALEGAATQDVFSTLKKRWPIAKIHFYPSLVQGVDAAANIMSRLIEADEDQNDVILLVRGGGSIEDLFAFFDEQLLRCIYNLHTPIITGVGHETDTTLVDYVSDRRAATPTAAAVLATPVLEEVLINLQHKSVQLLKSIKHLREVKEYEFTKIKNHPYIKNPNLKIIDKQNDLIRLSIQLENYIHYYEQKKNAYYLIRTNLLKHTSIIEKQRYKLSYLEKQLIDNLKLYIEKKKEKYHYSIALLDAYSPLKTLQKGYVITYNKDGELVKQVRDLHEKEQICIYYQDGNVKAIVERIEVTKANGNKEDI